jgi:hypothetical protein
MKVSKAVLLVLGVALLGCSDDKDPTSPTITGSLSFLYTGAGATNATTYSASGAIPSTVGSGSSLGTAAWASGSINQAENYSVIGAAIPKTASSWDITSINVTRTTAGTTPISSSCDDPEATTCTGVFVVFNLNPNGDSFTHLCSLDNGSVTITAISSTNITGTFAGSGICLTPLGAISSFTITNGTFNVGVNAQLLE